jgi:glyoxylase-like metal-dependent hydrolase (beta-lactamase superfamily II)
MSRNFLVLAVDAVWSIKPMNIRHALIAAFLTFATGLAGPYIAHAAAPLSKAPPVGFYRMMLGDYEVTALLDGTLPVPVSKFLTNTTPDEVEKALARQFLKDPVVLSDNAYLVNTGVKLVLIDAGGGQTYGNALGALVANLKAAGYQPEQVDEVYITHMHADHVGGLVWDGKAVFPNAIVRADKHEADYWLSQANLDAAPKNEQKGFADAIAALKPYVAAGKFITFDGNTNLVTGVRAVASRGHTPGHTTYVVESKGERLTLWGDLMHVAAVQFPNPAVTISFDIDSKAAAVERQKAFADAADKGYWIAAAHLSFPGIGHIRKDGDGYVFVPTNFAPAR